MIKEVYKLLVLIVCFFTIFCNSEKDTEHKDSVIINYTPEKQAVLDAVLRLHDGMRNKDGTLATSAWHDKASSYNISINKEGETKLSLDDPPVDLSRIKNWLDNATEYLDEELFDVEVFIDGDLAMAWVPYKFYRDKTFSHSGTNAFTLVKVDTVWKIVSVTDTRYFSD